MSHARRRASQKRAVEPLEVLAHQPARQEVVGLDRLARRIDHAPIADPAVASATAQSYRPTP